MQPSFLVLVPPLLVLFCAFYTKRIISSLLLGIFIATFIATNFSPFETLKLTFTSLQNQATDIDNLYTFGFLIILGIVLSIITHTGGALALGNIITKRLKRAKSAETSSLILSSFLAIDDYLNCLTTGYVMRPLTDKFKIPRLKLSFLINSMTAPTTILIPFSTWAGYIIRQFMIAGITTDPNETMLVKADPLITYFKTIPYIFYSFLMISTVWFIVRKSISFGQIGKHERIAQETGNLFGGKDPIISDIKVNIDEDKISLLDFFVPMLTLFSSFLLGVLYSGNFYIFGGTNGFIQAFRNSKIIPVLFYAATTTLIITLILSLIRKTIKPKEILPLFKQGALLMVSALLLIFLAWTFSSILRDNLNTGAYLAGLISKSINVTFLPFIFFLVTASVSIIIGSSWGTIALMLPITVEVITQMSGLPLPINIESICTLIPCLGAVFSGAVAGNHLSPIADVSIMTTTSTGAYHIEHVKAQFIYALPVFICTGLAYLISGFISCEKTLLNISVSFAIALAICWIILNILNKKKN
jgi:tetracycline resistance efflux pump